MYRKIIGLAINFLLPLIARILVVPILLQLIKGKLILERAAGHKADRNGRQKQKKSFKPAFLFFFCFPNPPRRYQPRRYIGSIRWAPPRRLVTSAKWLCWHCNTSQSDCARARRWSEVLRQPLRSSGEPKNYYFIIYIIYMICVYIYDIYKFFIFSIPLV